MLVFKNLLFWNNTMHLLTGKVLAIFTSHQTINKRLPCEKILLDTRGIINDKYYNRAIERSVLITSVDSYQLLESHNIHTSHGKLGENLLISYNPYKLKPGTQLQIGTTILEISQYCTICEHLTTINDAVPKLLEKDRGIFAKVIASGEISLEDEIYIIK